MVVKWDQGNSTEAELDERFAELVGQDQSDEDAEDDDE
jgi:hypothetical protein